MAALRFIAGAEARCLIEKQGGLTPDLVKMVLAASGGPKWLVLQALDQEIFGHWLPQTDQKIDLIGSSIGAWRMAGAAHPDPARKLPEFHMGYFDYRYQKGESMSSVSRSTEAMLDAWLSLNDKKQILKNDKRPLHISVARSKGLVASANPFLEGLGLSLAALFTVFDRRGVGAFYDRIIFSSVGKAPYSGIWQDFKRTDYTLLPEALRDVIMASCSIPFLVEPLASLPGAPDARYRDGGFIDYHYDIPFKPDGGLVLYPHFYPYIVPGWFDKKFKKRRASAKTRSHMLILAPSEEHVASLPGGRLTDRSDFLNFDNEERIALWRKVTDASRRLADDFRRAVENPDWLMSVLETDT